MAKKPTAAQLVAKIHEAKGNISAIARAYRAPRSTVYGWIESYETAQQALSDERESVVDTAESKLFEKIDSGEMNAIFYLLNNSREAKKRGWGPRQELTGADGKDLPAIQYITENRTNDDKNGRIRSPALPHHA